MEDGILYPRTTLSEEPLRLAIKNNHYAAARILLGTFSKVIPSPMIYFSGQPIYRTEVRFGNYAPQDCSPS